MQANPGNIILVLHQCLQEDYNETLAFLGLVNTLLATLGAAGLPAGGIAVAHYTAFVLQHVVGQLWQRGYKCVTGPCVPALHVSQDTLWSIPYQPCMLPVLAEWCALFPLLAPCMMTC